jgi:plasmid stabilization system protein ParE
LTPEDAAALSVHPDAEQELRAEIIYYDDRSGSVGDHFVQVIRAAVATVRDSPARGSVYLHDTRRLVLREFPFSVIYRASSKQIVIYAFAHTKRRPGYWRSRLSWEAEADEP